MDHLKKEIKQIVNQHRNQVVEAWNSQLVMNARFLVESMGVEETQTITRQITDFLIQDSLGAEKDENRIDELLSEISHQMTTRNISPSEISVFVLSLKNSIISVLREHMKDGEFISALLDINPVIDHLGFRSFELFMEAKEETIREQQKFFRDISVPVVKIWNRIIMIPLVGMLDSERTQLMMETLLTALEETQSKVAILDISGIPVVDTLVARHLITTASAVQLMGAECIITGIRAKIAQTLVHLGVDLGGFVTRNTLADGLQTALKITEDTIG